MRRFIIIAAAPGFLAPLAHPKDPPEITLEVVKQKGYADTLQRLRGKVVVVDVWGDFCIPCKKEFPHLVELHEKYAGRGVACVSVSLDQFDAKAAALNSSSRKRPPSPTFCSMSRPRCGRKSSTFTVRPRCWFLTRPGSWQRFDHNDIDKSYTHADVEKAVAKLLDK